MATKYWYGGAGNWNSGTAHWSLNSGNSPANTTSNPTSSDDVIFDSNSGTGNSTVNATTSLNNLTFLSGYTGTVNGASTLNIGGSLTLVSGMTYSKGGTTNFVSTSTGKTITTAGLSVRGLWNFTGTGGSYTLQDNLTFLVGSELFITNCKLDTGGYNIVVTQLFISSTATGFLELNNSTITLTSNASVDALVQVDNVSNFDCGTSTIQFNTGTPGPFAANAILGPTSATSTLYYNVINNATNELDFQRYTAFNNITFAADSLNLFPHTTGAVVINGNLISNGTAGHLAVLQSDTSGSAATISKSSGTVNVSYMSIKDSTATGGATWIASQSTNVSGNTGWFFGYQLTLSDSISNAVSRLATVAFNRAWVKSLSDSILNGASRFSAITFAQSYLRSLSVSMINGASRFTTIGFMRALNRSLSQTITISATIGSLRIMIRNLSDSMMNKVSRLVTFKVKVNGMSTWWYNDKKHANSSFTNENKSTTI